MKCYKITRLRQYLFELTPYPSVKFGKEQGRGETVSCP